MKTAAIIAEYNPFHKGHEYQIARVRELTGADYVLIIMSGDFVQRGTPAIIDKYSRTRMALSCGADAVIELPVFYACASAELFASGAVTILDELSCIDTLCFGCENAKNADDLVRLARLLNHETDEYRIVLQEEMRKGTSFPAARMKAVAATWKFSCDFDDQILHSPNNILALEYLRALDRLGSSIIPTLIQRAGAGYHDLLLASQEHSSEYCMEADDTHSFASATAIRNIILTKSSVSQSQISDNIKSLVPDCVYEILSEQYENTFPVTSDDFSSILHYLLLRKTAEDLESIQDITPDLANKIIRNRNQFQSFEQYCTLLKSRDITYSRISRCLLHIILDIKKAAPTPGYAKLLGFRKDSTPLLSEIKKNSRIPLITRPTADYQLSEENQRLFSLDTLSANVYSSVCSHKFHVPFVHEYERQVVRL